MILSSRVMFDGHLSGVDGMTDFSPRQLVVWNEHLKIGQPKIDAQHEAIFALAQKSSDFWRKRNTIEQLKLTTEELHEALAAHFAYEEAVLAGIGYADFAEHRAEHRVMLDEMQLIRERVQGMDGEAAAGEQGFLLLTYILSATVGHIFHSDMDYRAFAREAVVQDSQFVAVA